MSMLKNLSIKTKITSIILMISGLCIFLVLSIFIYINHQDEQESMVDDISVLAQLIGNRSNAALTFNDKQLARDNLASLQTHPSIILACLYKDSGELFAEHLVTAKATESCQARLLKSINVTNNKIDGNRLVVIDPIFMDDEYRGSMYILASLQVVQDNLTRYLLIALIIGLAVGAIALMVASRLQNIISQPLISLTKVAEKVGEENDYSVRAEKFGKDEIGALVDSFNEMLETIDKQNKDLRTTSEKAKQANAIKSQFLANMSHELRTPINGVLGMLSLLLSTEQTKEQKEYSMLANQSGNVLLDTVNQILDLASIESVGLTLQPQEVDMSTFLDDIAQLFSSQLATQQLDLTIHVANKVPARLKFDPVRVRQVFINLVANAIKFTKKGGVSVRVDWYNDRLSVLVEDTGIGIPSDAQARVFESFQQVDNSSTRPFGGTGLGLPISQQICAAMNGSIKIERSTHAGTVFSFCVDVSKVDDETITLKTIKFPGKVLALTEVSPLGNWLEDIFEKCKVKCEFTQNLEEAKAGLDNADLVLVDAKYGVESLSQLVDQSNSNEQQFVSLTWVGEDLPEELEKRVSLLYKPITTNSLAKIFNQKQSRIAKTITVDKPFHILIVDDNNINLKAIESQLKHAGFTVDTAENGLQAVHACRKQHYDLILMDIQMPEMDGLEATRLINLEQKHHAPQIIGISAHVMEEHINNALDAGMADYLCKPIKEDELLSKMNAYLSHN